MEGVKDDRYTGLSMDLETVPGRIPAVVVFDDHTAEDWFLKAKITVNEPGDAPLPVTIDTADVDLNFCGCVQPEEIKNLSMIGEFKDTAVENHRIFCIDKNKLVRVHGDSHIMVADECPKDGKLLTGWEAKGMRSDVMRKKKIPCSAL